MRRARPMLCVWIPALLLAVLLGACTDRSQEPTLFERLEPSASGVTFENTLLETAEFNIISYLYYFNGGGVAAGDVNDDGLPDLYFTANEGPNALYLNRTEPGGPVRFEDITEAAGVAGTSDWTTGVSMADVDGDGRLDLYVSALGGVSQKRGRNELFLNEGVGPDGLPRFREAAAEVGLDFEGYGTQSLFFDYDRDGDLDVYLLNHAVHTNRSYSRLEVARERDERSGDRLYRNVTPLDAPAGELPRFVEVTQESGIRSGIAGYGLAIVATDADNNGWPDIYVGNDFHENDFLYLNNGPDANGTVTFTEVGPEVFPHTSRFSMGVDAADLNGDGYSDFVVLDMLPRRADVRAVSGGEETRELAALKKNVGYHPQVARNTLQISRGPAPDGTLRYSDAAHFAGMEATDWSWASLLVDLDLDGHRDLFVTNGIWRRPNDLDFINYASGADIQRDLEAGLPPEQLGLFEMMPQVPIPNEAFRGTPGIAFEDTGDAWGLTDPGFSNGTATVDLDNDGDLDLVVNNINAPASVYVNTAADAGASSLQIVLEGAAPNTQGIGATVTVTTDSLAQRVESFPTRGYLSSVDPRLTVGLGGASQAKEVHVRWPDGRVQTLTDVAAGSVTLRQADAVADEPEPAAAPPVLFTDVTDAIRFAWAHQENNFEDFGRDPLVPHALSTLGPALAVGDVNGDGRDDVFVGGAKVQPSTLFLQTDDGFAEAASGPWHADSLTEVVTATLFDANGDAHLDLHLGLGGNEFWGENDNLRDCLFFGNGTGAFTEAPTDALPGLYTHTGTVAPADVDGDGDTDLFVGGRVVAKEYGRPARSALLLNDGTGRFADATAAWAPSLERIGMVSAATWADLDGDDRPDLALAGEWMAPVVFRNTGSALDRLDAGLSDATGWWTALAAGDLDGDGDVDLALGNLGQNSIMRTSPEHPARLWMNDFDDNEVHDGLVTIHLDGQDYSIVPVPVLQKRFPELRKQYPTATEFGARTPEGMFGARARNAEQLTAETFASMVALNDGTGRFTLQPLPDLAQLEPIYAFLADDLDGDGRTDLALGGGLLEVPPERGRYDAGYGLLLRNTEAGFDTARLQSGFLLDGEVRALQPIRVGRQELVVVARNNAPLQFLRVERRGGEDIASR